jgi:phosphatidylserine/phosphatidylglycerophosphate/cardiolipin synthase-like enzyme
MNARTPNVVLSLVASTLVACGTLPTATGKLPAAVASLAATASDLRLVTLPEARDAFFLRALRGAKKVIRMQVYLLTHQGVIAELTAAKARGVDVQVMLEPQPFNQVKLPNPFQPKGPDVPANQLAAMKLALGGVQVVWTSDAFNFTHAKVLTVDDAVTYVSTANFTRSGLGVDGKGAREYVVEDRNPADVAEFVKIYQADRAHAAYTPTNPHLVVSPVNARQRILGLVAAARREITIQVEVAGDPELDALLAAKRKAGVRVRALLADVGDKKKKTPKDTKIEKSNSGGNADTAKTWAAAGIEVKYQDSPHLHGKAVVVDGQWMYVGSVNLTTNSMDNNRELGLVVAQPDIVGPVRATFEHDFAGARGLNGHKPLKFPRVPKLHLTPVPGFDDVDEPDDDDGEAAVDEDLI